MNLTIDVSEIKPAFGRLLVRLAIHGIAPLDYVNVVYNIKNMITPVYSMRVYNTSIYLFGMYKEYIEVGSDINHIMHVYQMTEPDAIEFVAVGESIYNLLY